jgi:molybdopterin-binding protein
MKLSARNQPKGKTLKVDEGLIIQLYKTPMIAESK